MKQNSHKRQSKQTQPRLRAPSLLDTFCPITSLAESPHNSGIANTKLLLSQFPPCCSLGSSIALSVEGAESYGCPTGQAIKLALVCPKVSNTLSQVATHMCARACVHMRACVNASLEEIVE